MAEDTEGKEPEEPQSEDAEEASGSGRKKLIVIAAASVLVLVGAGAGYVFMSAGPSGEEAVESAETQADAADENEPSHPFEKAEQQKGKQVAAAAPEATASGSKMMGTIYALDTFVVNIGDGDRDRYLKLKAELELSKPAVAEEIDQRLPQIRDLVISLLGNKSFDEIRTMEGKDLLREEFLQRINALLVTGKARKVFFTEFVVQ